MKLIAIAMLCALCAACSSEESPGERYDRLLAENNTAADPGKRESWIAFNQQLVRAKLRDGDSAKFRAVAIHQYQGAPLVCGEVNANNAFGGKAGYQRFIGGGQGRIFLEEEMAAGEMDSSWAMFCNG